MCKSWGSLSYCCPYAVLGHIFISLQLVMGLNSRILRCNPMQTAYHVFQYRSKMTDRLRGSSIHVQNFINWWTTYHSIRHYCCNHKRPKFITSFALYIGRLPLNNVSDNLKIFYQWWEKLSMDQGCLLWGTRLIVPEVLQGCYWINCNILI